MKYSGTPSGKLKLLSQIIDCEKQNNIHRSVSFIKTLMYTKSRNAIFVQNGLFIKTDKAYLYIKGIKIFRNTDYIYLLKIYLFLSCTLPDTIPPPINSNEPQQKHPPWN